MDFLDWAQGRKLPKALKSRSGWAALFEHYRSREPHLHQIEPTNRCSYTCVMCPRDEEMTRAQGLMEISVFKKVIDEVAGFSEEVRSKEIELFHFGESLLHPKIVEMTGYASRAGLRATLSVNPCELSAKLTDEILSSKPHRIIVSLDSMDAARYRAIRGNNGDIEAAIANTQYLLEQSTKQGLSATVTLRMIVMDINRDETEAFRAYWEARDAVVELREFFPWGKSELEKLGEYKKYPPFMPCPFSWQYLVVQYNGDVVPCCRDYNGLLKLGNVKEASLYDIWNGTAYEEFREKMTTGEGVTDFCRDCLDIYYTEGE